MTCKDKLIATLSIMLGLAEIDALDEKSNEWRSAMIDAREALAAIAGNDPIRAAAMALLRVMQSSTLTPGQARMLGHVKRLAGVETNRQRQRT